MADNRLDSSKSLENLCRFFLASGMSPKDLLRILFAWSLLDLAEANDNGGGKIGGGTIILFVVIVGVIWMCSKSGVSCNDCPDCESGSSTITDTPRRRHPQTVFYDLDREADRNREFWSTIGTSNTNNRSSTPSFQYYTHTPYEVTPHQITPYAHTPNEIIPYGYTPNRTEPWKIDWY